MLAGTLVAIVLDFEDFRHARAFPTDWHGWPPRAVAIRDAYTLFSMVVFGTALASLSSLWLIDRTKGGAKFYSIFFATPAFTLLPIQAVYSYIARDAEPGWIVCASDRERNGPLAGVLVSLLVYGVLLMMRWAWKTLVVTPTNNPGSA